MVIKYEDEFLNTNIIPATQEYPTGSAKNETEAGRSGDGTVVDAKITNDFLGVQHAILKDGGVSPSGQLETALNSDVLTALRKIFGQKLTLGGNWEDVVGSNIAESDKRKYWIYEQQPYGIIETYNSFPLTIPTAPTDQPSIFYLIDDVKRFEMENNGASIPTGSYMDFPDEDPKKGFLRASGALIKQADFPDLFAVIGRMFCKADDDPDTFRLPQKDLEKKVISGHPSHEADETDIVAFDGWQHSITSSDIPSDSFRAILGITAYELNGEQYLAVVDLISKKVFIFTTTGSAATYKMAITSSDIPNDSFSKPVTITAYELNGEQYLAVGDEDREKVFIFTTTGSAATYKMEITSSDIPNDNFNSSRAITAYELNGEQYLAVADDSRNKVFIFKYTSYSTPIKYKHPITSSNITDDSFSSPFGSTSYTINENSYIAITDKNKNKVFIFTTTDSTTTYHTAITSNDITGDSFSDPRAITSYKIGDDQYLAVTDNGTDKIYIFTITDTTITYKFNISSSDITEDSFNSPLGITSYNINNDQYLAVPDYSQNKVFIFLVTDTTATYKFSITSSDITGDSFSDPKAVTSYKLGDDQYLAVTDQDKNKIYIFLITSTEATYKFQITDETMTNETFANPKGITSYEINNEQYLAVVDASQDSVFVFTVSTTGATYKFKTTSLDITDDDFSSPESITSYQIAGQTYFTVVDSSQNKAFIFLHTAGTPATLPRIEYQNARFIKY